MSTTRTLQRAGLAAIALIAAVGSTVGAQAATVFGIQEYVPADTATVSPGAPAATHVATVWGIQPHKDYQNSTSVAAKPAPENKAPRSSNAGN